MVGASVQLPASEREVVTDEQGRFLFEGLPIGTHRVRIEEDGFLRPSTTRRSKQTS